jgi:uncharacterized protein
MARQSEGSPFASESFTQCGMQEFLDFVIPLLFDYPEDMALTRHEGHKRTTFLLKLRQSDVGKVIGKHGLTIIALRNLLAASAARHGERAQLEIVEEHPAGK